MKNYVQPGDVLDVAAPYDVASGGGALIGSLFGVATHAAVNGAALRIQATGVIDLAKTSALAIAAGDKVYWDNTNKVVNKTASGNTLVGVAVAAAANPSASVWVKLGIVA